MRASIFCKIIISALLSALISMTGAAQISRETTANSYLERGIKWLSKGETERAKSDFDLAIASNPKSVPNRTSIWRLPQIQRRMSRIVSAGF